MNTKLFAIIYSNDLSELWDWTQVETQPAKKIINTFYMHI